MAIHSDRGMVTVELALGTIIMMLVTYMLVWVVSLGIMQMRCQDAALQGARLIARGQIREQKQVAELAPKGAKAVITRQKNTVVVTISIESRFLGLGPIVLQGVGSYLLEPGES